MKQLTIAGSRIPVTLDIDQNILSIMAAIDWAADNDVNIISTPECALSGYMWHPVGPDDARVLAITRGLMQLQEYSVLKGVDLVLGTAYYDKQGAWSNMQAFIVDGHCECHYAKQVLTGPELEYYTPGASITVMNYHGRKISGLICNDLWSNPVMWPGDSAFIMQGLRDQQVDIVFVSAHLPSSVENQELFNTWNNTCIRMYSLTGGWHTVVSDRSLPNAAALGPVGIVDKQGHWQAQGHDHDVGYFKFTVS